METQKPKIALYVKRSFGDKLTATFSFVNENWKVLLKYCTYLILPLCLIQGLSMNSFMQSYMGVVSAAGTGISSYDDLAYTLGLSYGVLILLSMIGGLMLTSLVYGLVKLYNEREDRLAGVTFADLKPLFFSNAKRLLILWLFLAAITFGVVIVMALLIVITPWTMLLTIPFLIACIFPLTLLPSVYLFEKIGVWQAFLKCLRLGFATWGGIFGVTFVTGFIANVVQGVLSLPYMIVLVISVALTTSGMQTEMATSVGFGFMNYLFAVLMTFGIYLSMIFTLLGVVYQYGHACELMDSVSVEEDINRFDQL